MLTTAKAGSQGLLLIAVASFPLGLTLVAELAARWLLIFLDVTGGWPIGAVAAKVPSVALFSLSVSHWTSRFRLFESTVNDGMDHMNHIIRWRLCQPCANTVVNEAVSFNG